MSKQLSKELLEIIRNGENYTVEFKTAEKSLPKELFETICAFLNRNGGHIFLGVRDNGDIVGVDKDSIKNMKKDFANLCNNTDKIKPTIYLILEEY